MGKLKRKWVILGLVLVLLVGLGGKVYMDRQREASEREKYRAEKMSVEALKNTFEGIKSVEFKDTYYNVMTGSYSMIVKMTNSNNNFVEFDYLFGVNGPNEINGWGVIDEKDVQKKGITNSKVRVEYSNGEKGEV